MPSLSDYCAEFKRGYREAKARELEPVVRHHRRRRGQYRPTELRTPRLSAPSFGSRTASVTSVGKPTEPDRSVEAPLRSWNEQVRQVLQWIPDDCGITREQWADLRDSLFGRSEDSASSSTDSGVVPRRRKKRVRTQATELSLRRSGSVVLSRTDRHYVSRDTAPKAYAHRAEKLDDNNSVSSGSSVASTLDSKDGGRRVVRTHERRIHRKNFWTPADTDFEKLEAIMKQVKGRDLLKEIKSPWVRVTRGQKL